MNIISYYTSSYYDAFVLTMFGMFCSALGIIFYTLIDLVIDKIMLRFKKFNKDNASNADAGKS